MNNFYAPVGPRMKLTGGPAMERPLLADLFRSLVTLLFFVLVPLMYLAIFRARKKHAMTTGE